MTPNHDGTPATQELPPAPAAIGAVRSASRTRLGLDPTHTGIAMLVTLALAIAAAFAIGALLERFVGAGTTTRIVLVLVFAPFAALARWLVMGDVAGPAITAVGADGFAIGRVAKGALAWRTIAFRDVGRMNLDKQPVSHARYGHVGITLQVGDRRGKRLATIHGKVSAQVANATASTTLAEWERVEEALRGAPTDSAAHFVRAISDAWTART